MATPGRKPKPAHLKLLEGNPGQRPVTPDAVAEGDLDAPPEWMTEDQRAAWRYAIEHGPVGILKMIDAAALTIWVVAESMHRDATIKVQKLGMVVKSPIKGEPIQNPYLAIVNRQAQIMLKAAAELGFTPSARARVGGNTGGGGNVQPGNKFNGVGQRPRSA